MANSITSFNTTFLGWDIDALSAEVNNIRALKPAVTPFKVFTTVFGDVPTGVTNINIPIPVYPTGSNNLSNGPVFNDATTTTVTVVCNNDAGYFQKFNPSEVQNAGLANLVKAFIEPSIYGVDRTIFSASMATVISNTSNVTSSVRLGTGNTFSSSAVTALASELGVNNIPAEYVLVETTRYWGLIADLASKGNQAGADAIRTGSPNNPFGVAIFPSNLIPASSGSTGIGTGNVVGIAGSSAAVAVGTAIPNVKHANGEQFLYVSPDTGMSYLVEQYFDESRRAFVIGASLLYGTATGTNSAEKITDKA